MPCVVAIVDCIHADHIDTTQITLAIPIDTTSKTVVANFDRPGCYIALWFYFTRPFFLEERNLCMSRLLTSLLLDNAAVKISAAQGLGNSCTGEPNSVEN